MDVRKPSRFVALATLILATSAMAQIVPSEESLEGLYPGKAYSPYAQRSFPSQVFWGEMHVHTGLSADAGLFGNILGVDDAYRFARGEELVSSSGLPVKLGRPLDWLMVSEHTDLMGFAPDLQRGAANILATAKGTEWYAGFQKGGDDAQQAAVDLIRNFSQGTLPEKILSDYSPGSPIFAGVWDSIIKSAERFNEPGRFTAFIGFEWTSVPQGNNLHRNVILRDGAGRARQVVPMLVATPASSRAKMRRISSGSSTET